MATTAPIFSKIDVAAVHIPGSRAIPQKKKGTGSLLRLADGAGNPLVFQTPVLTTCFNTKFEEGMNGYGAQVGMRLEGGDEAEAFKAFLNKLSDRINVLLDEGVLNWTGDAAVGKYCKRLADESHPTYPPKFVAGMKVPSDQKKNPDAPITTVVVDAAYKALDAKKDVTIGKKVVAIVSLPFIHFNKDPKFSLRVELDKVMLMDSGGAQEFSFNLDDAPEVAAAVEAATGIKRCLDEDEDTQEPTKVARAAEDDGDDV